MKKFFSEFKAFITRGNVVDLAVGMIIGAAFTAIVTALVNDIFRPLINMIPMGNVHGLITILVAKDATGAVVEKTSEAIDLTQSIYINWGSFIMAILNFLITAFVLFLIIKTINTVREGGKALKGKKKGKVEVAEEEPAPVEPPKPTTEELLLEIRNLLAAQGGANAKETKNE